MQAEPEGDGMVESGNSRGYTLAMEGRFYSDSDIALMLRAKRRLEPFIRAIEAQDARSVAKHLAKVLPGDDGTLRDMYLSDPSLLAGLKSHLRTSA